MTYLLYAVGGDREHDGYAIVLTEGGINASARLVLGISKGDYARLRAIAIPPPPNGMAG